MVMVKLKMKTIYKSFLLLIGLFIIMALIIGVLYLVNDNDLGVESDIEVNGNLSINYIDGKNFNIEDVEIIKVSITNSSVNNSNYNLGFLQVRGSGHYKLFKNNEVVTEGELKSIDEITTDFISIEAGETIVYSLEIKNTGSTILKGILNIRTKEGDVVNFSDVILSNNKVSTDALTKVGDQIAVVNEGLIKSSDDLGVSYYFRGKVLNNYVSFGDVLWRIVRINGDGTVRLVLDNVTDTVSSYYKADASEYGFDNSNMNTYLENWLKDNLSDETEYIANSKFCNDISHDEGYTYNSYTRVITNKIPTFNCLGDSVSNNVGLLTVDEVILAGASPLLPNSEYYLHNSSITDSWYTMSGASGNETGINMFMVNEKGELKTDVTGILYRGVRPVINLIKNIKMTGTGTIDDPYKM